MTHDAPQATGRLDDGWVVLSRTFAAPAEDVWAALTEPARLRRWIGTWTGDPESGRVDFFMTAEGEDVGAEPYLVEECVPPRLLRLRSAGEASEGMVWQLRLVLDEDDGSTRLDFAQVLTDPEVASQVGPGWEYYLDRLVAVETGGDVAAVDFADYHPRLADHYRSLVG